MGGTGTIQVIITKNKGTASEVVMTSGTWDTAAAMGSTTIIVVPHGENTATSNPNRVYMQSVESGAGFKYSFYVGGTEQFDAGTNALANGDTLTTELIVTTGGGGGTTVTTYHPIDPNYIAGNLPDTAGTYVLKCTVDAQGNATVEWVAEV